MKWGVRARGQCESCGEEGSGVIDGEDQDAALVGLQVGRGQRGR